MASLLQLSKPFKPFTTQQPKQRLLRTFALPARNVIQAAQKQHGAEAKVEAVVSPALAGIVACTLSTSIFAQRAIAEEVAAAVEESGFQLPTTPEEWVTYILFVVVVGLLTVVTGGVAYINITNWLDARQETQEREALSKNLPSRGSAAASASLKAAESDEVVVPLRKALRPKKDKTKGFAADFDSTRK